jgi:hypothetical protein
MLAIHDEPVEVLSRGDTPEQFLLRGRLYVVRGVLAHWVEPGGWRWAAPSWPAADPVAAGVGAAAAVGAAAGPPAGARPAPRSPAAEPVGVGVSVGAAVGAGAGHGAGATPAPTSPAAGSAGAVGAAAGGAAGGPAAIPGIPAVLPRRQPAGRATVAEAGDRELWRVAAAAGRSAPAHVFDLCRCPAESRWTATRLEESEQL